MKRRRRHDRLKRIRTVRREDRLFFSLGTIPRSACVVFICSCGARGFSRDPHDRLDDVYDAHAHCDIDAYAEAVAS